MTIDTRDIEGCESAALAREHDEQVRVVDQSDRDPSEVEGHLASPGAGGCGGRSGLLRYFEALRAVEVCRGGGCVPRRERDF